MQDAPAVKKEIDFPRSNRYFPPFLYEVSVFPIFKAVPNTLQAVAWHSASNSLEPQRQVKVDTLTSCLLFQQ
jgi:hypothetical protein